MAFANNPKFAPKSGVAKDFNEADQKAKAHVLRGVSGPPGKCPQCGGPAPNGICQKCGYSIGEGT